MSRTISIIALPNSSGSQILGATDIFNIANIIANRINESDVPLFNIRVVSMDGEPVVCSSGYQISVDGALEDIQPSDIVYVTAFSIAHIKQLDDAFLHSQPAIAWLRSNGAQQEIISTSCSGSFLLAEAGLLDGKQTTTAWWLAKHFSERYPKVQMDFDAISTLSDNVLCGAGTTSYQDICMAIVEKYAGKHFARLTAKYLMVDNQRRSQAPYNILSAQDCEDAVVNKAEQWIRKNISTDFRIDDIAEAVSVSPRTLIRRFQNALGETPQSFMQKLRIVKCKILLETTQLRFSEIVPRCGYNDESAFRRMFKRHCQLSPRDYRRRFNTTAAVD